MPGQAPHSPGAGAGAQDLQAGVRAEAERGRGLGLEQRQHLGREAAPVQAEHWETSGLQPPVKWKLGFLYIVLYNVRSCYYDLKQSFCKYIMVVFN